MSSFSVMGPHFRFLGFLLLLRVRIGLEFWRTVIYFEEPDLPVREIVDELAVLLRIHFSCPDYLGVINISFVIHPFLMRIVTRSITYDHQLFPFIVPQICKELRACKLAAGRD